MNRSHPRNKRELPKNNSHQNINVRSEPTAPTRISEALSSMTYKAWNYSRNRNMKLSLPTDNSHHVGWAKLSCKILAVMVQQVFIQYLFRFFFFLFLTFTCLMVDQKCSISLALKAATVLSCVSFLAFFLTKYHILMMTSHTKNQLNKTTKLL